MTFLKPVWILWKHGDALNIVLRVVLHRYFVRSSWISLIC